MLVGKVKITLTLRLASVLWACSYVHILLRSVFEHRCRNVHSVPAALQWMIQLADHSFWGEVHLQKLAWSWGRPTWVHQPGHHPTHEQ